MRKFFTFLCAMLFFTLGFSQGHETFDGLTITGSSYSSGIFPGQDGSDWEFFKGRGDEPLNGKAFMFQRNSNPGAFLESGTLQGGIGTLQFSYKQAYNTNVELLVYVNGNLVYTATTENEVGVIKTSPLINVNVAGDFTLKFVNPSANTSGQVVVDDIIWTAYDSSPLSYCTPEGTNSTRYIDDFSTTGGTQNISNMDSGFSTDGYGDFTATHTVEQIIGQSVSFSAEVKGGTAGFRIWVDWNQDGVFDTTEEVAYNSTGYLSVHTGSFTVPNSAMPGETRMRVVSHYLNSSGLIDPCATGFAYGEFEDYKFVVNPLDSCTGTPDAGTAIVTPAIGNPNSSYTVSTTGTTMASGMTYQWQSNTNGGGWVNEGTAASFYSDYTATASATEGDVVEWRLMVTCNNSQETSYSTIATFTVEVNYCIPAASNANRYINNFSTTDGIQNISNLASGFSTGGYGNFYDTHTVEAFPSTSVDFTADVVGGTAGIRVWVDWNQDGTFDTTEEVAYASTSYKNSHTGTINVPADALTGETRMRVVSNYSSSSGSTDPCQTVYSLGEFEDYKFVVTSLPTCTGTPDGGTAMVNPAVGNPGSSYTVSANDYTLANGITYLWQSNTNNEGWVDQGAETDTYADFTATAPSTIGHDVMWRLKVTCSTSQESDYSSTATFTTEITYCIPTISSGVEPITRVIFNDLDNSSSASSAVGYEDFTAEEANVIVGTSYEIKLEGNTSGNYTNSLAVWMDWNQNGVFEADERYEVGTLVNSTGMDGQQAITSIEIPTDAIAGETRMRVIKGYGTTMPSNPCGSYSYGQIEDYTVIVEGDEPEPLDYCTPEGTNSARYINNFTATGNSQSISNLNSGFSTGGYGDFFDTHTVEQIQNEEVQFTSNVVGGTAGFRIWVDWNQDGVFDATEEVVYNSTSYKTDHSGSFIVPASATLGTTRMRVVSHWLSTTGDVDPCATGFTYGEFEDYKFVVSEMQDCSGTPDGGTITLTPAQGEPGSTYIVSATGQTIANGVTYQWQSNDGSGWVNQGALLTTYENHVATAPSDMDEEVEWRLEVTCTNSSETVYSDTATFTTGYCTPQGTESSRFIDNFETTGGIQNISNLGSGFSPGGYGNFYDTHTLEQIQGEVVNFTSTVVGGTAGFRIWVDWNQDGVFDATEEVVYASTSYSANPSGSFEIPTNAMLGETRMRIVSHYLSSTGNVLPCATGFTYGEFEDYKLVVSPMPDCSGTPEGGTITITPNTGNPGSTYVVSSAGYTMANGMTYQWQSNTNGQGWENQGAPTTTYANYTATAPSEIGDEVEWRLEVTCTNSNESAYSDVQTFTTVLVYCNPTISTVEPITRVNFADIDNVSDANSNVKIEDFTAIVGNVEIGETYDIALEGNTKGNYKNYFTVWIDWNQNGTFDADEMQEIGMIQNSTGTDGQQAVGEITIPDDALQGTTRMRVIKSFNSSPTNPCGSYSFGQVEDYTLNIAGGTGEYTCADQNVPSNGLEGTSLFDQRLAVDIVVGNDGFNVYGVDVNVFTNNPDVEFTVNFLADDNGMPGAVVEAVDATVHSSVLVGNNFGFDVYTYTLSFATPVSLTASTRYWMEIDGDGALGWEKTTSDVFESSFAYASEGGNNWAIESGSDLVYALVCEELGVNDFNSFKFAYYPNPVKDVLNIQSQKDVKFVEVFNLTGQRVISNKNVQNGQINVSTLTNGTYIFRVTLEDGKVETFKIIKK